MQTAANLEAADLTNWTKAQFVKSNYAKIQGELKFQGTNLVNPTNYLTIQGWATDFRAIILYRKLCMIFQKEIG